jgi:3-hydroxyisobutyrate dehydrogenase-like beta-hydroxyacid dehydrogenase
VCQGSDGILSAAPISDGIVVDFSTTEIAVTRRLGEALAAKGIAFIDAPVSGGPSAAEAGTLAIMAGGRPEAVAAVRPLVERFGLFTHMGDIGAGQATKLVNQALCLTNYCIVAEGLRLAEAYGVDASKIPAALAPGLGNSAVLQAMMPRMIEQRLCATRLCQAGAEGPRDADGGRARASSRHADGSPGDDALPPAGCAGA